MSFFKIEQTPIWEDIKSVLESSTKAVNFNYKGMLHTEKEDIPIYKIVSLDILRDYVNNISDQINIEFKLPLGEYITRLFPYRNNLEFSIKRTLFSEGTDVKEKDSTIYVERYKAIFLHDYNPKAGTGETETMDTETLNKLDFVSVRLELHNRSLEAIRIKTTSGIFKKITQKQLIQSLLVGESNKILLDGKPSIDGFDIVEPENTEVKSQVIIPSLTHITAVPTFLQEKMGGVYSAAIGNYFQIYKKKRMWFVYPLYNVNRFNKGNDKAIFYSIPGYKLNGLDRTYNVDGSTLHVISTSAKSYTDTGEVDYMNHGVGFRTSEARSFMKKPIIIDETGPKANRAAINHEVATSTRKDGLNYAAKSSRGISANPFIDYSLVAFRSIARIDLTWESCQYELIYPGMPCKYMFMADNKINTVYGTILAIQVVIALEGPISTSTKYATTCAVTLAVENIKTQPTISKMENFGEY